MSDSCRTAPRRLTVVHCGEPADDFDKSSSSLADLRPRCRMFAAASPPPRTIPSRGTRGQPVDGCRSRLFYLRRGGILLELLAGFCGHFDRQCWPLRRW